MKITGKNTKQEKIVSHGIVKKIKHKKKENVYNARVKPYMEYLGIKKYNAILVNYYLSSNEIYFIESDYLETFCLKIFDKNKYKYSASIEKHFITTVKNLSKLTSKINVAYDATNNLEQFLFTDRMPGANKKWKTLTEHEKLEIIKDIAKIIYKIHTYHSKKVLKHIIFGRATDSYTTWEDYLNFILERKLSELLTDKEKSDVLKYEKYAKSEIQKISTQNITPTLLHGSISLNKDGYLRSLLFLGTKITAVLNSEESIYGDRVWDLVFIYKQILSKKEEYRKTFFREYGKLRPEEQERLEFYVKLI